MKRLYLVKGEERHEVEVSRDKTWVLLKGNPSAQMSISLAKHLGYTLEEVETRREWWIGSLIWRHSPDINLQFLEAREKKPDIATALGEPWVHVTELPEGHLVLSREDVEKAWYENCRGFSNTTKHNLIMALGFKESE